MTISVWNRKNPSPYPQDTAMDRYLYGGAEPLPIFLAQGLVLEYSDVTNTLEEGRTCTYIRKLPLIYIFNNEPLKQILLIGKDSLQGPRNGRRCT